VAREVDARPSAGEVQEAEASCNAWGWGGRSASTSSQVTARRFAWLAKWISDALRFKPKRDQGVGQW